jgi:hypothetical protein
MLSADERWIGAIGAPAQIDPLSSPGARDGASPEALAYL